MVDNYLTNAFSGNSFAQYVVYDENHPGSYDKITNYLDHHIFELYITSGGSTYQNKQHIQKCTLRG